jgi:hypothetical protein
MTCYNGNLQNIRARPGRMFIVLRDEMVSPEAFSFLVEVADL